MYLYMCSATGSNVPVAHDSLKKDPNMQSRNNMVHVGVPVVVLCACTSSIGDDLKGRKMLFNAISFLVV